MTHRPPVPLGEVLGCDEIERQMRAQDSLCRILAYARVAASRIEELEKDIWREEMSPQEFRKKPVVIEAMQVAAENVATVAAWCGAPYRPHDDVVAAPHLLIPTLEGTMRAEIGDWIIRGVKGEFYPCKPDIFAATYEPADLSLSSVTSCPNCGAADGPFHCAKPSSASLTDALAKAHPGSPR